MATDIAPCEHSGTIAELPGPYLERVMIERYLDGMHRTINLECSLARLCVAVRWHHYKQPSLLGDHDFVMLVIEPVFPLVSSRDVPTQRLPVVLAEYAV